MLPALLWKKEKQRPQRAGGQQVRQAALLRGPRGENSQQRAWKGQSINLGHLPEARPDSLTTSGPGSIEEANSALQGQQAEVSARETAAPRSACSTAARSLCCAAHPLSVGRPQKELLLSTVNRHLASVYPASAPTAAASCLLSQLSFVGKRICAAPANLII